MVAAGGLEQGKIIGEAGEGAALFALFQDLQHFFGAGGDRFRQAGELGDMDAVAAVGGAGADLVQKHDLALPLLDPHRVAGERRQFGGEGGQLVVMGREQGATAVDAVQMLERRPGDRQPVKGRGAAADLVEDHKG